MSKQAGKAVVQKKAQALERLVVVYVPIEKVRPNTYNPNRQSEHEFELLCRSMREDGFTQPIVTVSDEKDPIVLNGAAYGSGGVVIVDGEHRWRAANHLGLKEVPCAVVPMNFEQARIATLRHNKARGSHDINLEVAVLRDLEKMGALEWAQDSLMMDDTELQRLMADVPAPEALAAEQHSEAWEPASAHEGARTATEVSASPDGSSVTSMTPAAVDAMRKREVAFAQAKTDEEKAKAKSENDTFRLVALFTGPEAVIVRSAIGTQNPAAFILEVCKTRGQPA